MGNAGTVFASHAAREGDGGVRTISTGRLSWLYFFCSWVVCSSTYMGRGRVARIRYIEPLGHAARKAASAQLLPQARTWGTLEPRRSCTLAARGCAMPCCAKRKGAPRCCNRGRRYGHLHPFAHRCSAPSLAPEAAAGAAESHRWYNVEDYSSRLSAHEHHPGRKRHELSARSTRTHTQPPPSHRSGLWSLSGVAEEGVAAASDALFVPRCSMLQTRA